MKGRKRSTGHLSDFRDGRRSVFVDLPTWEVNPFMRMGAFRARIEYAEMKKVCYRCLQEGHTARDCTNEEVCRSCRKPGHRKDQCPSQSKKDDQGSDSDSEVEGLGTESPDTGITLVDKQKRAIEYVESVGASVPDHVEAERDESKSQDDVSGKSSQVEQGKENVVLDKDNDLRSSHVFNEFNGNVESPGGMEVSDHEERVIVKHLQTTLTSEGDSPSTDFINNVQFADLPVGSSKVLSSLKMSKYSKNEKLTSLKSGKAPLDTPVSWGPQKDFEYKEPENEGDLSSVWGDKLDEECPDDELLMAAKMAENKVSGTESEYHDKDESAKEIDAKKDSNVYASMTFEASGSKLAEHDDDRVDKVNSEPVEAKAGASVPNFVSAGKRLFNAIVSPTESKKKSQRDAKSKKK